MAHGILNKWRRASASLLSSICSRRRNELARPPERAVDVMLNEGLEKVEHQLILVLDDYHHRQGDGGAPRR